MAQTQQNHYSVLNVPFSASRKEITTAYRQQMREWHPDKFNGADRAQAEELARQLNLAYSVLSDAHKRADYDRTLRTEAIQAQIMERYVAGSSGWNLDGQGPVAANAPRRPMSAREKLEQKRTDRNAMRSLLVTFGMLAAAALLLLLAFAIFENAFAAVF